MKVIYFGDYVSEELNEQKPINPAGNKWQKNLLDGLRKYEKIEIFSYFRPRLFPNSKQIIVPNSFQKIANHREIEIYKYINLPILREIFMFFLTITKLIRINYKYRGEEIKIIQYNIYSPVSLAIFFMSYIYKYDYIPIILDIVLEDSYDVSFLKRKYLKLELFIQKKIFKKIKKVIVINSNIIKDFFENTEYLLIEGGISKKDISLNIKKDKINKVKKIIFTGALDRVNGIDFLINTLEKIPELELELELYGTGELVRFVRKKALIDRRILYKGFKSNLEILEIQKNADYLIIPRRQNNLILRYTFPSKLFEYMLSETPILMTNIPGLKKEYLEYVNVLNVENEYEFSKKIQEILMKDQSELIKKAKLGKEFLLKNKSWEIQALKILKFISKK
ncbi:MAG: glycosyltransferase [Cetobacterium sp.]